MIEKFQQGGQLDQIFNAINSQPEQALQQLVQSGAKPEDIIKIVQAGVQQGKIKPEIGQAILQAMQGQKVAARHGIKLNYVKSLKNKCAEDEEVVYYKKGGSVKCGCKKKEEGGEVKKDCGGSKMKKFKMAKGGQQSYINPNDTVHVNGKAYVLTNMNGTPVNKKLKFPKYEGKVEKEDRAKAQKGDKDAKRRQAKAEEITAPKCGGKVKKHQEGSIITKFRMHRQGGSLNRIPFMPKAGKLPKAQKAEERYKNSKKYTNGDGIIDADIKYSQQPTIRIFQETPYSTIPASITRTINSPIDTSYIEVPPIQRFSRLGLFRPWPVERKVSTLNPNGKEYEILKRRFNTALNLAK